MRFGAAAETPGRRLLFIGSFRHFPNVAAFRYLTEEILPLVADAELTVVAGPDPWPHWSNHTGTLKPPENRRVQVLEFVADVRPLYTQANVVVVPKQASAGTNVKVLEALAMQRAVVSTTTGCAGLGLEHGKNVWIADTPEAFAEGVARLLDDDGLRRQIAEAGRETACRGFDPLELRRATEGDLAAIARIQAASPEASQWEPADYLAHDCWMAFLRHSGDAAGFLVSRRIDAQEREILNLAVEPSQRGGGVASRLLERELDRAETAWFLEVRESNQAAIRLYESVGFVATQVRRNYYNNPDEAGIVMRFLS